MKLSRNFLKRNKFKKSSLSQKIYSLLLPSGLVLYLIELDGESFVFRVLFTDTQYQGSNFFELLSILNRKKIYYEETPITEEKLNLILKMGIKELLSFFKEKIEFQTKIIKL